MGWIEWEIKWLRLDSWIVWGFSVNSNIKKECVNNLYLILYNPFSILYYFFLSYTIHLILLNLGLEMRMIWSYQYKSV